MGAPPEPFFSKARYQNEGRLEINSYWVYTPLDRSPKDRLQRKMRQSSLDHYTRFDADYCVQRSTPHSRLPWRPVPLSYGQAVMLASFAVVTIRVPNRFLVGSIEQTSRAILLCFHCVF